jgi:hypothetical protein
MGQGRKFASPSRAEPEATERRRPAAGRNRCTRPGGGPGSGAKHIAKHISRRALHSQCKPKPRIGRCALSPVRVRVPCAHAFGRRRPLMDPMGDSDKPVYHLQVQLMPFRLRVPSRASPADEPPDERCKSGIQRQCWGVPCENQSTPGRVLCGPVSRVSTSWHSCTYLTWGQAIVSPGDRHRTVMILVFSFKQVMSVLQWRTTSQNNTISSRVAISERIPIVLSRSNASTLQIKSRQHKMC